MPAPGVGGMPYMPQPELPINPAGEAVAAGGVRKGVPVQTPPDIENLPGRIPVEEKTAPPPALPTFVRKFAPRDIVTLLINNGLPATEENKSLALKMLSLGLEVNKDMLLKLQTIIKSLGGVAKAEDAAVIAALKGFQDSPAAVKILAAFLEKDPQLANQIQNILILQSQANTVLSHLKSVMDPTTFATLTAALAQFEGELGNLAQSYRKQELRQIFNRERMINDSRALKSLIDGALGGIDKEAASVVAKGAYNSLSNLAKTLQQLKESLTAHAILTKVPERTDTSVSERYAYWHIPNPEAKPPRDLEILVKRDTQKKGAPINPLNTKLIIKTESPALGELAIEVNLNEDNLDLKFFAPSDDTQNLVFGEMNNLREKLQANHYKVRRVQVLKNSLNTKQFIIPTVDLDNVTRVQTEA